MHTRILVFSIFFALPCFSADSCKEWFNHLEIKPNSSGCVLKCAASLVDMSSFDCPNQCETLCKKQEKCKPSLYTKSLLKEKMLFPKDNKTIATHRFSKEEAEKLQKALEKINPKLFKDLNGVVKFSPLSPLDIGNYSKYLDKYIILYPKTFQTDLLPFIVHELGHHLHEVADPQSYRDYLKYMKWEGTKRPGEFLSLDSKRDPTEDFSTNFEAYIMHPESLKSKITNASLWMNNKFKDTIKLKDCDHE